MGWGPVAAIDDEHLKLSTKEQANAKEGSMGQG
jgi:hypothetical protein